jgi:poly(A) polymerase
MADPIEVLLQTRVVSLVRAVARARGEPVIVVGGAVRDALLGRPVHDFDFAAPVDPIPLARRVADRLDGDFYVMDAERRTARVIVRGDDGALLYLDFTARRGQTWDDDLFARDFSLNAMAVDLGSGELLDPAGGQADLARRVIRQASPYAIDDDPVRALRAARLAQALGAQIDAATASAASAARLSRTSPERARDELMKLLAQPGAARGTRLLDKLGLLVQLVPEVEAMRGCAQSAPHRFDVLEHTFVVLEYLDGVIAAAMESALDAPAWLEGLEIAPMHRTQLAEQLAAITSGERQRTAVFRLAALLHDAGKPGLRTVDEYGVIHFYRHEQVGAEMAAARAVALKLSNDEVQQIATIVHHHMRPNQMSRHDAEGEPSTRTIYRFMRNAGQCAPELALFCIADGMGKAGADTPPGERLRRARMAARLIRLYYEQFSAVAAPAPLVTGRDLLQMGIPQGPRIGRVLEAIREAQMVGEIATREDALRLAAQVE